MSAGSVIEARGLVQTFQTKSEDVMAPVINVVMNRRRGPRRLHRRRRQRHGAVGHDLGCSDLRAGDVVGDGCLPQGERLTSTRCGDFTQTRLL
jgi:small ligand-binding sensory domain FIST